MKIYESNFGDVIQWLQENAKEFGTAIDIHIPVDGPVEINIELLADLVERLSEFVDLIAPLGNVEANAVPSNS